MRPARSLNVDINYLAGDWGNMPDNLLDLQIRPLAQRSTLLVYRILVHHVATPDARYPYLLLFVLSELLGCVLLQPAAVTASGYPVQPNGL